MLLKLETPEPPTRNWADALRRSCAFFKPVVFGFATVSQLSEPSQMIGTWRMSYLTLALLVKKVFITVLDGKWSHVRPSGLATLKT